MGGIGLEREKAVAGLSPLIFLGGPQFSFAVFQDNRAAVIHFAMKALRLQVVPLSAIPDS